MHHTKHGEERHNPKTENLLYQNQSHSKVEKRERKSMSDIRGRKAPDWLQYLN